jgi:hypothetical protein
MVGLDDVRELDWIPESEGGQEWVPTPEEILDALMNRPAIAVDGVSGLKSAAVQPQDLDPVVSPR